MNMGLLDMFVIMSFLSLFLYTRAEEGFYVYPTILQERTNSKNLVLRLNSNLTLNLEKSSVLADNLLLVTSSHEGQVLDTVDTSAIQEVLYQDVHHQSSLVLRQREGVVEVEGIINHELRIKPLPQDERSLHDKILHKIYKVQEIHGTYIDKGHHSTKNKEEERSTNLEKFTAEIHVISDSVHQKVFKNNEELIAYLAVMTNAVNLRYLDMKNPRVSYILVGITRSKDDPFIRHKQGYLLAAGTLAALKEYNKAGKVPGNPDMIYLVTGQDLARVKDGKMDPAVTGLAALGAVCTQYAAGEGEDTARTYSGTHTMAHELAHIIGAPHDDGRYNDPECAWSQGYLMSYVDGGVKRYRLSRCSEDQIRAHVKKLGPECIEVKASQNYQKDHRKFPGQTMRDQFYCRTILKHTKGSRNRVVVKKDPQLSKICKMDCCSMVHGYTNCRRVNVPAGMACDRGGKTCKRGVCGFHTWEQFK
ncbi:venom metalloproteinase antarease-like TtrivMP_A isoform X2 [Dermacentor andersoni]|uniref:venom metalloproteinase antarease-like TtrivMP_A isoform X2 n=1 Tax=Dermacentor andersoni TaxID=34620 RepID=UPI0024174E2C|nr:venom metalloproteinase antarease-like TtrivMP_A isoform X2 [Dermacentor andersoni]